VNKTLIFMRGSKTYFTSSIFFPPKVREDVFTLYAFVRTADDLVDSVPQRASEFRRFRSKYLRSLRGKASGDPIIDDFVELQRRKGIRKQWVEAFLNSMAADLRKSTYRTLKQARWYIYGSAEVIGLCMARILDLPAESYPAARAQGRAMQYINFIRDIAEDNELGRTYIPAEVLQRYGLRSLKEDEARAKPEAFKKIIRAEIARYRSWQAAAAKGYHYIPRRYRIPIKTAAEMYEYTATRIAEDPFVVYKRKVKPGRPRILLSIAGNTIKP
jgi:15-cis-phytoene synthase